MGESLKKYLDEDIQLMLQIGRGNSQAFTKIYNKYFSVITDYIASHNLFSVVPEDIAQEVFSRIWHKRAKYHPNSSVKTFLFGYARNVLLEELARSAKALTATQNWSLKYPVTSLIISSNPKAAACRKEFEKTLEQAISRLSVKQGDAVRLTYGKGMSLRQGAIEVKCTIEAFRSRLRRGHKKLAMVLQYMDS